MKAVKNLFFLIFLFSLVSSAQAPRIKIIFENNKILLIEYFLVSESGFYLSADELFSKLELTPVFSKDENWLFVKIHNQLVTVDLKKNKAVIGELPISFNGIIKENGKWYISEDFLPQVYARQGVKIAIEKPILNHNAELDSLPEKFKKDPIDIIVIDPGHGGINFGANTPSGWREKDLTLKLALKLGPMLRGVKGLNVYLTREDDRHLSLEERSDFANRVGADLFISLHINGFTSETIRGFESYFLSLKASDEESRRLAMLENLEFSGLNGNQNQPLNGGFSELELILSDMAQNQHLAESEVLAKTIQKHLGQVMEIPSRGVKQAPFKVLMGANMPAVLVELGYLTNPDDLHNLTDPKVQDKIVSALAISVLEWKKLKTKQLGMGESYGKKGAGR